jgi:hypothetical protein
MFVARRWQLKSDGARLFRRLRKLRSRFQVVFLIAINLVAGADPEPGSVQVTRFRAMVEHWF